MSNMTILTGPERRRRWSEDERRQILAAAFSPGAVVAAVARQYAISTGLLYKWRQHKGREQGMKPASGVVFAPAILVDDPVCLPRASDKAVIIVDLADGRRVSIDASAPAALVSATLTALR
jgi:transposase